MKYQNTDCFSKVHKLNDAKTQVASTNEGNESEAILFEYNLF